MSRAFSLSVLIGLTSAAIAACQSGDGKEGAEARMDAAQAREGAPTLDELKNATYHGFEDVEPVTLVEGRWEGEPYDEGSAIRPEIALVGDFRVTGDLDGDGVDEAVTLLNLSTGGTGQLLYVAVLDRQGGEPRNVATEVVGDRVQVRGLRVEGGQILLDVVQAGPEDPACCPGEVTTRGWELLPGGGLNPIVVVDAAARLSPETIDGTEWVLSAWDWDEPAPEEPEVTLGYEDGRLVGKGGCNNYFAAAEPGEMPGDVSVGPVGSTQRACPELAMSVETRFLVQLGGVMRFGFLAGQLALTYEGDDERGVMLFDSR